MDINDFYRHHGLRVDSRPFDNSDDAKQDTVFENIIETSRHPDWNKFLGSPGQPSTALIFGGKGSGKTALRLQMRREMEKYNLGGEAAKNGRIMVVDYADFNPFHSAFLRRLGGHPRPAEAFADWGMADHLDAILSLAVTKYVDEVVGAGVSRKRCLSQNSKRNLMFLDLVYDNPVFADRLQRWRGLDRIVGFTSLATYFQRHWDALFSLGGLPIGVGEILGALLAGWAALGRHLPADLSPWLAAGLLAAGFLPGALKRLGRNRLGAKILKSIWVLPANDNDRRASMALLRRFLPAELELPPRENGKKERRSGLAGNGEVVNDRFALLEKFQDILAQTGYSGLLVIVDQVDEPTLIQGDDKAMWMFIRSILDNQLLQRRDLGFKFLLPAELYRHMDKEDDAFKARARLDKQNLVKSLDWSGSSLVDLANRRLRACAENPEKAPKVADLVAAELGPRLAQEFNDLRQPRNLFQFLNIAIKKHIGRHTAENPSWRISETMFEVAKSESAALWTSMRN